MNISTQSIDDLISLALKTTNLDEMLFLQKNPSMNVRRALARNRNIYDEVLNLLAYDPVENVSYMASQHPKILNKREFEDARPCVTCEKDEKGLYCIKCPILTEYSS